MKGSTNAMRGSADVVQSTSSISILDTIIQNSTDSQPGLMSAADHQQMTADHATLSTTVSRVSTCESGLAGKQDKLTFDTEPVEGSENPITSGGVYSAISGSGSGATLIETDNALSFIMNMNLGDEIYGEKLVGPYGSATLSILYFYLKVVFIDGDTAYLTGSGTVSYNTSSTTIGAIRYIKVTSSKLTCNYTGSAAEYGHSMSSGTFTNAYYMPSN